MPALTMSTATASRAAAARRPRRQRRAARVTTTAALPGGEPTPPEKKADKKPFSLVDKAVSARVSPQAAAMVLSKLEEEVAEHGGDRVAYVSTVLKGSAKLDALTTLPAVGLDLAFLSAINAAMEQLYLSGAEGGAAKTAGFLLALGQFNFQFGAFQGVGRLALNLGTAALWSANPEKFVAALEVRAGELAGAAAEADAPAVKAGPTAETLAAATEAVFALRSALVSAAGGAADRAGQGSLERLRLFEVLTGLGDYREAYGLDAPGANALAAAFVGLDRDGNGFVDRSEWEAALSAQAGTSPEDREVVTAAFGMVDSNDDGRIAIDEFAALWTLAMPVRAAA